MHVQTALSAILIDCEITPAIANTKQAKPFYQMICLVVLSVGSQTNEHKLKRNLHRSIDKLKVYNYNS